MLESQAVPSRLSQELRVTCGCTPSATKRKLLPQGKWPSAICFELFVHCMRRAAARTCCTAGSNIPIRMPMIAMTPIRVKHRGRMRTHFIPYGYKWNQSKTQINYASEGRNTRISLTTTRNHLQSNTQQFRCKKFHRLHGMTFKSISLYNVVLASATAQLRPLT